MSQTISSQHDLLLLTSHFLLALYHEGKLPELPEVEDLITLSRAATEGRGEDMSDEEVAAVAQAAERSHAKVQSWQDFLNTALPPLAG